MSNDISFSLRQLRKTPLSTAVAILSLLLGIGVNTAIFSLISALVLQPLPIPAPGQLVRLTLSSAQNPAQQVDFSLDLFQRLSVQQQVFSSIFAWTGGGISNIAANGFRYTGSTSTVSGEYFAAMAVAPYLGRFITNSDLSLAAGQPAPVAVIDYRCWTQRFAADPQIIGKTVRVEDVPLTIIGVAPEQFHGLIADVATDVTVPIGFSGESSYRDPKQFGLEVYGRLKATSSLEQAQAQLNLLWPQIRVDALPSGLTAAGKAQFLSRRLKVSSAAAGTSFLRRQYQSTLTILLGMAVALLLLTCLNLAGLTLARAAVRRSEFAIRLALGASVWRLRRQILVESLLLTVAGALPAILLARYAASYLLQSMWSGFVPLSVRIGFDWRVLTFTVAVSITTALLFGWVLPSRSLAGLRESPRTVHRGASSGRILIPAQIALSLVLVLIALLFVRSVKNLRTVDVGFRNNGLLVIQLFPQTGRENQHMAGRAAYYRELTDRLRGVPGVEDVSYSHMGPLLRYESKSPVAVSGATTTDPIPAVFELVGPGFFHLAGMRLLAGRDLLWTDKEDTPGVAVISESLARHLFPAGDAVGHRIDFHGRTGLEIVGVVNSASLWMPESHEPQAVFLAFLQEPTYNSSNLDIRYHGPPEAIAPAARKILESMGRQYALRTQTIEDRSDRLLATQRIVAMLASLFSGLAMALAAIGLYGLLSQTVASRTAEIAVRLAIGAQPRDVRWLVLRNVMWLVLAGIGAGLPVAFASTRMLMSYTFGVSAGEPGVVAAGLLLLIAVSLLAAYVPTRRACRISPASALRM